MSETLDVREAWDLIDNCEEYAVAVNDGDGVHYIDRDRYNSLVMDTWIPVIDERRELRVTPDQVQNLFDTTVGTPAQIRPSNRWQPSGCD